MKNLLPSFHHRRHIILCPCEMQYPEKPRLHAGKGFTIQKDLSYPLFLAMQAMKGKGLDLNNYLITYSENITGPGIIRFNFS